MSNFRSVKFELSLHSDKNRSSLESEQNVHFGNDKQKCQIHINFDGPSNLILVYRELFWDFRNLEEFSHNKDRSMTLTYSVLK